jgi:hypothetical protein
MSTTLRPSLLPLIFLRFQRSAARKPSKRLPVSQMFALNTLFLNETSGPTTLDTISASVVPKAKANATTSSQPVLSAQETQSAYTSQLAAIPEFSTYGEILNSSSKPIPLTESETEYVVSCVKHIFKSNIVFQVSPDPIWPKLPTHKTLISHSSTSRIPYRTQSWKTFRLLCSRPGGD